MHNCACFLFLWQVLAQDASNVELGEPRYSDELAQDASNVGLGEPRYSDGLAQDASNVGLGCRLQTYGSEVAGNHGALKAILSDGSLRCVVLGIGGPWPWL